MGLSINFLRLWRGIAMKDSYWFRHDSNAKHDEKIIDLRTDLGYEGYGIFWALIEFLRDSSNYEAEYKPKRIAYAIQAAEDLIEQVINGYGLFVVENDKFYSQSLKERMKEMDRKRQLQRDKANKRWGKDRENSDPPEQAVEIELSHGNPTALPEQYHKIREDNSIVDKKKEEEKIEPNQREERAGLFFSKFESIPDPEMLKYLVGKYKIKNQIELAYSFFLTVDTIPKTADNETDIKNIITNGFEHIFSSSESVQKYKAMLCIAKYGFALNDKNSNKIVAELKSKGFENESQELEFLFTESGKISQPTLIFKNFMNNIKAVKSIIP
jgi:hypothetical protein